MLWQNRHNSQTAKCMLQILKRKPRRLSNPTKQTPHTWYWTSEFLMCHDQCYDRPDIILKLSYRSERGSSIVSLYASLRLTSYINLFSLVFVPRIDTMRTVISCPDILTNLSLMSWCTNREQVFREACKWENGDFWCTSWQVTNVMEISSRTLMIQD